MFGIVVLDGAGGCAADVEEVDFLVLFRAAEVLLPIVVLLKVLAGLMM